MPYNNPCRNKYRRGKHDYSDYLPHRNSVGADVRGQYKTGVFNRFAGVGVNVIRVGVPDLCVRFVCVKFARDADTLTV